MSSAERHPASAGAGVSWRYSYSSVFDRLPKWLMAWHYPIALTSADSFDEIGQMLIEFFRFFHMEQMAGFFNSDLAGAWKRLI